MGLQRCRRQQSLKDKAAAASSSTRLLVGAQDHGLAQDWHQRLAGEARGLVARRQDAHLRRACSVAVQRVRMLTSSMRRPRER